MKVSKNTSSELKFRVFAVRKIQVRAVCGLKVSELKFVTINMTSNILTSPKRKAVRKSIQY